MVIEAVSSPTSEDGDDFSPTAVSVEASSKAFTFADGIISAGGSIGGGSSVWSQQSNGSFNSFKSLNSRRVRWRKAGKQEQTIVTNVVSSCLRTAAPESVAFEDDRFHYFTGLHDLTALIMVNLESPSLSSLVLYVSLCFCASSSIAIVLCWIFS